MCMSVRAIYQTAVKGVSAILSEAGSQVRNGHTPTSPVVNPMPPLPSYTSMIQALNIHKYQELHIECFNNDLVVQTVKLLEKTQPQTFIPLFLYTNPILARHPHYQAVDLHLLPCLLPLHCLLKHGGGDPVFSVQSNIHGLDQLI